jgi:hypothetical protein
MSGVVQYDHTKDHLVKISDALNLQKVKILCGDPGDGVPNVLSDDDTFMAEPKKRQKNFGERKAWEIVLKYPDLMLWARENGLEKNYTRNNRMINLLSQIPEPIVEAGRAKYDSYVLPMEGLYLNLKTYFESRQMVQLSSRVEEFLS